MRIVGLLPFALTGRIEGQRYKSLQRQIGAESLRLRLTFLSVACLQKHGRVAARLVRPVEIRGHIVARQAFVDDLLDNVTVSLNLPGHSGIERPCVVSQATQSVENFPADDFFAAIGVRNRTNRGDGFVPRV